MIQIKVDVAELKSGRVAVELLVGKTKERPETKAEIEVACHLKYILAMIITELAQVIPGSSIAVGDDVETLKALENAGLLKDDNEE